MGVAAELASVHCIRCLISGCYFDTSIIKKRLEIRTILYLFQSGEIFRLWRADFSKSPGLISFENLNKKKQIGEYLVLDLRYTSTSSAETFFISEKFYTATYS